MSSSLQKAIDVCAKATEEDKAKNYTEALRLYKTGVKWFLDAIKYGGFCEKSNESIRRKCCQYFERIEELSDNLGNEEKKPGNGKRRSYDDGEDEAGNTRKKEALSEAIIIEKPNVHWDDVMGLDSAKEALIEAVIFPRKFPQLFSGNRKPWKAVLLFGPPGTGKTYLAKALATEAENSTFISVSPSDLLSKWQGESERLVRNLFEAARMHKPSIIFIDEIDALCSTRNADETESSRRIKTEFLVQMQGICSHNEGVFILGATNTPWMLDAAIRRRFEKRIYISLPDQTARIMIFKLHMGACPHSISETDFTMLGAESEGYSGADIGIVVRDALMEPIRLLQKATCFKKTSVKCPITKGDSLDVFTPCLASDPDAIETNWTKIPGGKLMEPIISMSDMLQSLKKCKPAINKGDLTKLVNFAEEYGQEC